MTPQSVKPSKEIIPVARHRVLVVDDEIAIHFAYRKLIEPEGYDVDYSANLQDAMALIRIRPYLAIITDMRLGGTDNEDGIELLRFIKEMQPEARIIISTGYGNENLRQTTLALGASSFFEKPVPPTAILSALKTISIAVAL
jgi:DNA-binding NtrC family response regulator